MNKVEIKLFLGQEVRVVNNEYIVLKDMFNALGRVKEDGTWTSERKKMDKFLDGINQKEYHETLVVLVKQGRAKVEKEVECLKLEIVPVVLTQFKPTNRKGKEAIDKWFEFMKFVNDLLVIAEAHKFIVTDKEHNEYLNEEFISLGISPAKANSVLAKALGIACGVDKQIFTKDIDLFLENNPEVTIDLRYVRSVLGDKYIALLEARDSDEESVTQKLYNIARTKDWTKVKKQEVA